MSSQVLQAMQGISHRCFRDSDTETGFIIFFLYGNVSLSIIAALCHAKDYRN